MVPTKGEMENNHPDQKQNTQQHEEEPKSENVSMLNKKLKQIVVTRNDLCTSLDRKGKKTHRHMMVKDGA